MKRVRGRDRFILAFLTALCICGLVGGIRVEASGQVKDSTLQDSALQDSALQDSITAQDPLDGARILYDDGQFQQAILLLQTVLQETGEPAAQNPLRRVTALSNLSLCYQQLGLWDEATQAIAQSLTLLESLAASPDRQLALAQALNIQGQLQLATGQSEQALATWQQATTAYGQVDSISGELQSRINQAQALQALGLYRRAIATLTEVSQALQNQPDSLMKAAALRSLGDALLVAGSLEQSQESLQQSLQIAQQLQEPGAIAATQLSLGNLTRAEAIAQLTLKNMTVADANALLQAASQASINSAEARRQQQQRSFANAFYQQTQQAIDFYQQAAVGETQIQAQLNQLNLLIETRRYEQAQVLYPQIQAQLEGVPPSRSSIYSRIDLAQGITRLSQDRGLVSGSRSVAQSEMQNAAQLLAIANQQAAQLKDTRAQSYALGTLGGLYEKTQQWQQAQSLTQQALTLSNNAADIAYRWQWQLGRLLKAQGDRKGAILAYSEAVTTLKTLRKDLVAVNRDVQFSFRESVEPVYRELVDLLLTDQDISQSSAEKLVQARDVIEGLQIAELDNFFREACLDTAFQLDRVIDQTNLSAAIFYTIVLPDRLEVILKLPQQALRYHTVPVTQAEVETTADSLLVELKKPLTSETLQSLSQKIYGWLIRPEEAVLASEKIETLVFVLDGSLRSIPMAALYDGQYYLIENYSVAIAPGLQLPDPKPLDSRKLKALVAGLSEARENFPALGFVQDEIKGIQSDVPNSQVLLNQSFTTDNFRKQLDSADFSIVHIATHGQFSSNIKDTFILAWDDPINVTELGSLLQARDTSNPNPIELLVLSACRTAVGDRRATLGLAGVAVRAGARSTIASLWNVDDDSGAALMGQFYKELGKNSVSKAEALRRAQRSLLANPQYRDPRFWSPYVLLGNWL
ncbi:MAG: CHAT domain-containing protein [Drouetiella hepatica Uher 2000/2452]|uniref:CHAT domain-containing protein n=1 Tax=Drouetiella hepatica Uher 2000/2452 TaxID=904376 RepID=A0A951UPB8_9CYAN|nr:CHAT domain-containing protein [Drouetiella hepatica Uher 2000/2452]